jgi:hypothetical protein
LQHLPCAARQIHRQQTTCSAQAEPVDDDPGEDAFLAYGPGEKGLLYKTQRHATMPLRETKDISPDPSPGDGTPGAGLFKAQILLRFPFFSLGRRKDGYPHPFGVYNKLIQESSANADSV